MHDDRIVFKPRVERKYIGTYTPRTDGLKKASGKALYADDLTLERKYPNMLYMKTLKSPYPHAMIKSIDSSAAEALPGVEAVLRYDDPVIQSWPNMACAYSDCVGTWTREHSWSHGIFDRRFLGDHARWVGDEVGIAVAATSEETAEEAIALCKVEWEVLPFVLTPQESLAPGAPIIHPEINSERNTVPLIFEVDDGVFFSKGDFDKAFAEAEVTIEVETDFYNAQQCALEPWLGMVYWTDDQLLVVSDSYCSDQTRWSLHEFFGVPLSKIRSIAPFQGGQHGRADSSDQSFYYLCSELSRRTGCPVKYKATRKECFHDTRTTMHHTIKLGATKDGKITACEITNLANMGAYLDHGEADTTLAVDTWVHSTPYQIPNLRMKAYDVYTNIIPSSCMRSIGNVGCNYILGRGIDELAEKLDMDPADIYIKSLSCEAVPPPNPCFEGVIRRGLQEIGWENRHKPGAGPLINGTKKQGLGFCAGDTWHTEQFETRRGATQILMKINPDGTVMLDAPTVEVGTGSNHCAVLAAAEGLGVHPDMIYWLSCQDTEYSLKDEVQSDSSVSYILGEASYECGMKLKDKFLKQVAHRFDCPAEELDMEEGRVFKKNDPETGFTIKEYFDSVDLQNVEDTLRPVTMYHERPLEAVNKGVAYMGAFVDLEVDIETGEVEINKMCIVTDGGTVLNPAGAEAQMVGGQVIGLGESLYEKMIYDERTGTPLNFNYVDYKFPTMEDFPDIDPIPMEIYTGGSGNFSCSGMGEGAPSCTPRAISNAIYNAIGVRIEGSAISPKDILNALGKAGE